MSLNFDELWQRLIQYDETVEMEVKSAEQAAGNSIMETISAFSNEPGRGGGYLLLGVALDETGLFTTYRITGVKDTDKVQAELATRCRTAFNIAIRPEMVVEERDGKRVIIAYIPEAPASDKPVFIESKGLPKGAFRRIGSTDQHCTDDDLAVFYQDRRHCSFDETPVESAEMDDFDPAALAEYRRVRKDANPTAPELAYSDQELLRALGCIVKRSGGLTPTIAGIVLFGKHAALRRLFPSMRVDYIRVPGREWVPQPDERFESVDMLAPLILLIPRVINAILDDVPRAFHLPAGANRRKDVPLIPRMVIREAVVNALMHRSYRQRQPIQIIRYANRLEIRNPGHSLIPEERLGEPGSLTRNDKIAAVLHETAYAENKGSGIRAMREALADAGLTPPTFESDRESDRFVMTLLFHHFLNPEDLKWLGQFKDADLSEDEAKALVFAREVGAINNAGYRDLTRVETLVASGHLRRLRDAGLLDQKGKSAGTYYVPTPRLLTKPTELQGLPTGSTPALSQQAQGLTPSITSQSRGVTPSTRAQPTGFKGNLQGSSTEVTPAPTTQAQGLTPALTAQAQGLAELPQPLQDVILRLGQRANPAEVRGVITKLCAWRPLKAEQISRYLKRQQIYVTRTHLTPMVRDGQLEYLYPDQPAHPQQAYRTQTKPSDQNRH